MSSGVRNTAIKRIQGDVREMMTNPSDQYAAAPLETNMFDWHFTLRGPPGTEFEGGMYHGRIILPSDYPFKPPNIVILTPNGRFEVRKKICLSISAHHPEEWQPAWGVRLILEALISFMPTKGEGAIGSLDFSPEERRRLARESVNFQCEVCGNVADLLPELDSTENQEENNEEGGNLKENKYASQVAMLHMHHIDTSDNTISTQQETNSTAENTQTAASNADTTQQTISTPENNENSPLQTDENNALNRTNDVLPTEMSNVLNPNGENQQTSMVDIVLHYTTVAIGVALFALIYKKLLEMHGVLQS